MNLYRPELANHILRISLGVMFIAHGLLKVLVFGMPGTVAFFESIGLPGALAWATVTAEFVGGGLLVAGLWTRWVSLALMPILLGAFWVHAGNGWVFSNEGGGWEYPLALLIVSVVVALQARPAPTAAAA